jgi:hypothetical protein
MDVDYIDKCRYELQEQKNVPLWYTDIYWPISRIEFAQSCLPRIFHCVSAVFERNI